MHNFYSEGLITTFFYHFEIEIWHFIMWASWKVKSHKFKIEVRKINGFFWPKLQLYKNEQMKKGKNWVKGIYLLWINGRDVYDPTN